MNEAVLSPRDDRQHPYHTLSQRPSGRPRPADSTLQPIDTLHTCPIPEITRLGRTLRQRRDQILAFVATGGVNNGGTDALNLIIDKTRRLGHGFRNSTNYRLCIQLASHGTRPYRQRPTHA